MRSKALRKGTIVVPTHYVAAYPMGASVDTRLVVVSATKVSGEWKYHCTRDDGREGTYWICADSLRVFGGDL